MVVGDHGFVTGKNRSQFVLNLLNRQFNFTFTRTVNASDMHKGIESEAFKRCSCVADELDADERVLVQQHEAGIGIARGFEPDETDDEERGDGASNEQVKAFGD